MNKDKHFLGSPCNYGHNGVRYKSSKECVSCVAAKNHESERKEYQKQYYNTEKRKIYQAVYQKTYCKTDKYKDAKRQYALENPEKGSARTMKYYAKKLERTPFWLTDTDYWMIEEAYELAALRTKITGITWHVDHIIPLQGKLVSGLHTPYNLQVIVGKINQSKGNFFVTN